MRVNRAGNAFLKLLQQTFVILDNSLLEGISADWFQLQVTQGDGKRRAD